MILFFLNSTAQSPIKSLNDDDYGTIDGAYYKDTENNLDNYTGTWIYTNGTTSLTISLQKKIMMPFYYAPTSIYEDILIGEYRYIENGIEKINTLSQLSLNLSEAIEYSIHGNIIVKQNSQYCKDCGPNDRKILLMFKDPSCHILGYDPQMIFQRVDSGGIQKLKLKFRTTSGMIVEEGVTPPCTEYKIPFGEYILIKQ
ncbi:MAG: hypothetical protein DI539_00335 [Flavobacterium psychrophilum]|nr:MAG: hypothetical protein DI539_00335 [Flavobacterium psychrophilum]